MYRITVRKQRLRLHTEGFLIYEQPLLPAGGTAAFGPLLRCYETILQPGAEWLSGPVSDLEVLTFVRKGSVECSGPSGGSSLVTSGGMHRLTAGGFTQFEVNNHSKVEKAEYLQLWFDVQSTLEAGSFETRRVIGEERPNPLILMASGQQHSGLISLSFDSGIYLSTLRPAENLVFETLLSRRVFLFVMKGLVRVEEHRLQDSDSAMIWRETLVPIAAQQKSQLVLVDLP